MPSLLIKSIPLPLHRRLRQVATENRRSMISQILIILEASLLEAPQLAHLPKPFAAPLTLTQSWINKAKKAGRS